jgi:predicted Zn-dependent protease
LESRGQGAYQHQKKTSKPPPGGIPWYIWFSAAGTSVLVAGCYYAFLDEAPITKRKRWIATSPQWEWELGDQEYRQLLRAYQYDVLPPDHRASVTLNRVGQRIAAAAEQFAKEYDIQSYNTKPYTYTVIRSDMANAFVLPGNHVFLMTGLFKHVYDEDELATIIGHETAHNLARHVGEKISGSLIVNLLARLSLLVDPSGILFTLILPTASLFRELPNSRVQEMEADEIGLQLAAYACYDPRAAKRVFVNMKNEGQHQLATPPEFLSTHPSHETRITNFDTLIPRALEQMNAKDGGERCRNLRKNMEMARRAAAHEAAWRERHQ